MLCDVKDLVCYDMCDYLCAGLATGLGYRFPCLLFLLDDGIDVRRKRRLRYRFEVSEVTQANEHF